MALFNKRITTTLLFAAFACLSAPSILVAQNTPPATATAPATIQARSKQAIQADFLAASRSLREALPSPTALGNAKFRKENADKVIPPLKKMVTLLDEVATTQNEPAAALAKLRFLSLAYAFGDVESGKALEEATKSTDATTALTAKSAYASANWIKNSEDAKAQEKILADFAVLAKANPTDDSIAQSLMMMSQVGAANADIAKKPLEIIRTTLTSPSAKRIIAQLDADKAQQEMIGKPLAITGRTTTNDKFSTEDWKGKVVLVDFWATWCGPCKAELPRVKEIYKKYHDKGLEMVGVDCDAQDEVVNTFTKENEMTWPQLREKDQEGWHPLATKYGVNGIPTMFLIDKKGVLRYVDAREDTEEKVKTLLEEAEGKMPTPAPAVTPAK